MDNLKKMQEFSLSDSDSLSSAEKRAHENPSVYLVETFYISSKKNTVFQVRLTSTGLSLRKESNGAAKEQTILLQDIVGCRCLRSKRRTARGPSCACTSLPGAPNNLKVVDENSGEQDETDSSAYLYIYAYILKRNRKGTTGRRERTTITLRFRSFDKYDDNNREAQKWRSTIKHLISNGTTAMSLPLFQTPGLHKSLADDTRKMLVLLNPKSGSGKAREVFQQRVAPIFAEAEMAYDMHVTKKANYAREFVRTRDIYAWRGIVVVGGDGIFFEVINGLFERPDWLRATQEISIGILPCGSGNGLARTIAHVYNEPYEPKPVLGATITVVRGQNTLMDLVRVETRSETIFSFLSVGWGLISDIDIESERIRVIGAQRFTLWSLHRLISLRTYHGRVSFMRASNYETIDGNGNGNGNANDSRHGDNGTVPTPNSMPKMMMSHSKSYNTTLDCPHCHGQGDCETCDTAFGDVLSLETINCMDTPIQFRPRMDSWYSATSRRSAYFSPADSIYQSVQENLSQFGSQSDEMHNPCPMYGPISQLPAITAAVPDTWTTIEGDFVMVHAAYKTHLGADCYFAPSSQLNNGHIWLLIIRAGVSRSQLLSFLLGLSTGTHLPQNGNEFIEMLPVTAFRIEPTGNQGFLTVDGERVEYGPIQGELFPGIAKIMVPHY